MKRGRIPDSPMRMVIRNRLEEYDVSRRTGTKDSIGQSSDTFSVSDTLRLWIYNPRTTTTQVDFGERTEGDLNGIALPDCDIRKDDRIEYGGYTYKVSSPPDTMGNESLNEFQTFTLVRVHN